MEIREQPEYWRRLIAETLPCRARWLIDGTPLDWDFSHALSALQPLWASDPNLDSSIPGDWSRLLLFGEETFAEGGGARSSLVIESGAGKVFGVDPERYSGSCYLYNSTIQGFIDTFLLLDSALCRDAPSVFSLSAKADEIDPFAYPDSEWKLLIDLLANG